jgi:endonuclease/exonuclease/phosphatase family metal-dependent hydrolase
VTAGWEPPPRIESTVRVATWNLWWRFGPWAERQPAILETLRRVDADIVCLQETWETRDGDSQPATLADALGLEHAHAAGFGLDLAPESVGNAILSRWPISGSESRPLPAPPDLNELRVVLRADIEGPRGPINVCCTHLNWRMDQSHVRRMQLQAVCEFIAETKNATFPPVLCGDLNAEPDSDEIRMLTGFSQPPVPKLVFFDSWRAAGDGGPGLTWDRANRFTELDAEPRDARIDYVLAGYPKERAAGEPVSCRIIGNEPIDGVIPSDHYGVVAELRY